MKMFKADKEKNVFLCHLGEVLCKDVQEDETFLKRLLWANAYIANKLAQYEDIYEEIG